MDFVEENQDFLCLYNYYENILWLGLFMYVFFVRRVSHFVINTKSDFQNQFNRFLIGKLQFSVNLFRLQIIHFYHTPCLSAHQL